MDRYTLWCICGSRHSSAKHTIYIIVFWQNNLPGYWVQWISCAIESNIQGPSIPIPLLCPSRYITAKASVYRSWSLVQGIMISSAISKCNLESWIGMIPGHLECPATRAGQVVWPELARQQSCRLICLSWWTYFHLLIHLGFVSCLLQIFKF